MGRGYIKLERDAIEHPVFARAAFSEFQAWVWLLAEANWCLKKRRLGRYIVDLTRGEVAASVRFLAEKWLWDRSKVERFLKRLKTEEMIETRLATGISIITICNYDKYQGDTGDDQPSTETLTETEARHSRDARETKQKKIKQSKKDSPSDPDFEEFWKAYPKRDGVNPRKPAEKKFVALVSSGTDPSSIIAGARGYASEAARTGRTGTAYIKHAITWLNQSLWTDYGAPSAASAADGVGQEDQSFWAAVEQAYRNIGIWSRHAGPKPGVQGCRAPPDVARRVLEFDRSKRSPPPDDIAKIA